MNSLTGKIAVITGGTSGIGAACVKRFAESGAVVAFTGRDIARGNAVEEKLRIAGLEGRFYVMDILDDISITETHDQIKSDFGRVDILFNNAGLYPVSPSMENITRESWNENFETNTTSMVMVIKNFLPDLLESHGVILNNASIAGIQSFASGRGYGYASSKAAVIQLTKMMAKIYGHTVRINCICPGVIETPLYHSFDASKFESRIPVGRVGTADDIAKVAAFLVSEDAAYMNGAEVVVDGGITL